MFTLKIEVPTLNENSKRQLNADVFCEVCGRGIPNRHTAKVTVLDNMQDGVATFSPIPWDQVKGKDPVEWGGFVGSTCAKKLPKEYKVSMKKVLKNGEW